MSSKGTTVRVLEDLLQNIRRVKSFLTLEMNEEIATQDAIYFTFAERVLGTKTVFDLVKGINDIRKHKEEKYGFSEAIREISKLLSADPSRRKSMIDNLDENFAILMHDLRKLPKQARNTSEEEMESWGERFAEILSRIEDLPKNPLVEEYRSDLEDEDSSSGNEDKSRSPKKGEE